MNRLPFRNESEQPLNVPESAQSTLYEFTDSETGDVWVRKELKLLPKEWEKRDAQTIAHDKQRLYALLQEYLGEYLPETHYVVAADEDGRPRVEIVQKKIMGRTYADAERGGGFKPEYYDARKDIMKKVQAMLKDERAEEIPQAAMACEAFAVPENIVIDENGKVWVVDWY